MHTLSLYAVPDVKLRLSPGVGCKQNELVRVEGLGHPHTGQPASHCLHLGSCPLRTFSTAGRPRCHQASEHSKAANTNNLSDDG